MNRSAEEIFNNIPFLDKVGSFYNMRKGDILNAMVEYANQFKTETAMPSVQNYIKDDGSIITFMQYHGLTSGDRKSYTPYFGDARAENNAKAIIEKHGAAKAESVKEILKEYTSSEIYAKSNDFLYSLHSFSVSDRILAIKFAHAMCELQKAACARVVSGFPNEIRIESEIEDLILEVKNVCD